MDSRILAAIAIILAVILAFALAKGPDMDGDTIARLVYGGLIAGLVSSWVLAEMRGNLGQSLRYLFIWGVIVAAIAFAYSYKGELGF
ncbi:MAG: hypothetical protein LCH38_06990 [Proteobacteria bacterium]|nr:hypothetical protein [Pseudomonadota bacterium]